MKINTPKKHNIFGLSLALPKFSVNTIYLLFAIVLIAVQIYNGFEVYLLVGKVFYLFNNVTNLEVEITNWSYLSEFYCALHESNPRVFRNNRALKAAAIGSNKLPVILLYVFFTLVIFNYMLVPGFKVWYYLGVGIHHIIIHKILHFLKHQKECKFYNCICWVNKVRRYAKNKIQQK